MAVDYGGLDRSFSAAADLSSHQYKFVVLTTAGVNINATTTFAHPVGVLQNKPDAAGKAAAVRLSGTSKVYMAGSTLAAPVHISASTSGAGVAATTEFLRVAYVTEGSSGTTGRIVTARLDLPGLASS